MTTINTLGNNKEVQFSGFAELCCRVTRVAVVPHAVELGSKEGYSDECALQPACGSRKAVLGRCCKASLVVSLLEVGDRVSEGTKMAPSP